MEEKIRELVLKICREAVEEFGNIEDTYDLYLMDYELEDWLDNNCAWRSFCESLESED